MVMIQLSKFDGFLYFLKEASLSDGNESTGKRAIFERLHCCPLSNYINNIISNPFCMFPIIQYQQLNTLYSRDASKRYQAILDSFQANYAAKPDFIARAPGRVNIIGQHIDYEGYGVLPAAIEKDCLIAVRRTESKDIMIHHVDSATYPSTTIPVDPNQTVVFVNNYVKYFRAGYRAGVREIPTESLVGLDVVIEGNVPLAAGVSSSSALCVCSALAAIHANNATDNLQNKEQFIERVITGERQTGTASGGMDQSISVMGKTNFCLYIQFHPIRCEPVHLPEGSRFVIMNSLVESAKLNTAVFRYNKRVCECRLAMSILAKKLKIPKKVEGQPHKILKELEDWSGLPLNSLGSLVDTFLERKDYTTSQIEEIIEAPIESVLSDIQLYKEVLQANNTFRLYQAARHVFDESYRVINFIQVCKSKLEDKDKLVLLGKLMNESQTSCSDLYECSCPEIDAITELARKQGAYGSRLTGAGWGGCTVSLVDAHHSKDFIASMVEKYYKVRPELQDKIAQIGIQNIVFQSLPSEGACIVVVNQ